MKKIRITLISLAVLFVLGFAGRFLYLLIQKPGYAPRGPNLYLQQHAGEEGDMSISIKRNYASRKVAMETPQAPGQTGSAVEQKYEKIGALDSLSTDFDRESEKLKSAIQRYKAVTQYEKRAGMKGTRILSLSIGIWPEQFDAFIEELRKIGTLQSMSVELFDKTSEFKDLNAERLSLEKLRDSLKGLKGQGGTLQDRVDLEMKILEVEKQIQELAVKLGEFSAENEFSTIRFTLRESKAVDVNIGGIILEALGWSALFCLAFTMIVFIGLLSVLILLKIAEKLKWLPPMIAKSFQEKE